MDDIDNRSRTDMTLRHLCAAVFALLACSAQAQVALETTELSVVTRPWGFDGISDPGGFTLLSSGDGVTRIAVGALADTIDLSASGADSEYESASFSVFIDATARAGFQVVGYRLDAAFVGQFVTTQPDETAGRVFEAFAGNHGYVDIGISGTGSRFREVRDEPGTRLLSIIEEGLDPTDGFRLELFAEAEAYATDGDFEVAGTEMYLPLPAFAGMRVVDPVLTIYTQPVPEPVSLVLLSAGMVVLVLVVRRLDRRAV